jgi:hypothetical protein
VSKTEPLFPFLTERWLRLFAALVVFYFISEFFVFLLHWVFVAKPRLESARRSLATFLFNLLIEIPLLFAIVFTLEDCWAPLPSLTATLKYVLETVFHLEIVRVRDNLGCQLLADYQLIITATLLTIIIASLVNTIARLEKGR